MNIAELFEDWLITECGFSKHQVGTSGTATWRIVIVYLGSTKLHFIVERRFFIDCCLMNGGMSTPTTVDNVIKVLFSWVDLRDPESLNIIGRKIQGYCNGNNRRSRESVSGLSGQVCS